MSSVCGWKRLIRFVGVFLSRNFPGVLSAFFLLACGGPPQNSTEGSETPAVLQVVSGSPTSFLDMVAGFPQTILLEIENISSTVPADSLIVSGNLLEPFSFTGGSFPGLGGSCISSLAASSRCSIEITIEPVTAGIFSDALVIQYFDGLEDQSLAIDLNARARPPLPASLALTPSLPQDFGVVAIGGSREIPVSLENTGEQTASVMAFTGLNPPFSVVSMTCGPQLNPGEICQWSLRFEPVLATVVNDTLQIDYNDGAAAQILSLDMSGEGRVAGFIAVDEGLNFDLGVIHSGFTSSRTLNLRNTGGGNASALAVGGLNAPFSIRSNTCPSMLAPAASCQVIIDFSPVTTNSFNDDLQIDYFDGFDNQTTNVAFEGSGFNNAPSVTLTNPASSPSNLNTPTFRIGNLVDGLVIHLYRDALCLTSILNGNATGTTLNLTPTIPEGTFPFHVRTVDADGNQSACSVDFVIYQYDNTRPSPPLNITYSQNYTTSASSTPTFSWQASPSGDVVDYEVGVSDNPAGGNSLSGWTGKGNVLSASQSGLSLTECEYYYVSVRSEDHVGLFSAAHAVSDLPFRYDRFTPTAPTNLNEGSDGSSTNSATITWSASSDACGISHYEVAVSEDTNANNTLDPGEVGNAVIFTNVGVVTSHRFNGLTLTNGVPHFTSIRAVDTTGRVSTVAVSDPWIVYDPSIELPDMIAWLDANDPGSVLDSSGRDGLDPLFNGQANRWLDKSGSPVDHDFTLGSGATRPSYDDMNFEMLFNGSNTGMTTNDHSEINTATVNQRNLTVAFRTSANITARQIVYEEGGNIRGMNIYLFNGRIYCGFYNTPDDGDDPQPFTSVSAPVAINTNYFVTWVFDYTNYTGRNGPDGDLTCYVNGTSIGSTTSTSRLYAHSGNVGLGRIDNDACFEDASCASNGAHFFGSIYEVMLFNNAPNGGDISNVHTYLDNKWN